MTNKISKAALMALLSFSILLTCTLVLSENNSSVSMEKAAPSVDGTGLVENTNILMSYNSKSITLLDKRNNHIWNSIVGNGDYDFESINETWKKYLSSILVIGYADPESIKIDIKTAYSGDDATKSELNKIKNGFSIHYSFPCNIELDLYITLENDVLKAKIPMNSIKENGKNKLVQMEILPFLGATKNTEDGYFIYPDGCGALMNYGRKNPSVSNKTYEFDVYSPEFESIDKFNNLIDNNRRFASIPVFGMKNGNNGLIVYGTQGEAESTIVLSPSGVGVELNRIAFKMRYRDSYSTLLSNITINGQNTNKNVNGLKLEKNIIQVDREVQIRFLAGDNANYSGMANLYRDYLTENQLIGKSRIRSSTPFALNIFMATQESQSFSKSVLQMTSYDQVVTILEAFKKSGVDSIQLMLKGWSTGGFGKYPQSISPEEKLGGAKGFSKIASYAESNKVDLYLLYNIISANKDNGGFNARNDVVSLGNNTPLTDGAKKRFFLNNTFIASLTDKIFKLHSNERSAGLALDGIGELLYRDYSKQSYQTRSTQMMNWKKFLEKAKDTGKLLAIEGGSQYVLQTADMLYNLPDTSTQYYITDEDIPFYQMVVHGYIPYSSDAANLFYDDARQTLKWVEYGTMPLYELTFESANKLKFTEYNRLFSSNYLDWVDRAAEKYINLNQDLKDLYDKKIILHQRLAVDLYETGYENGTSVFVNYSDKEQIVQNYTIPPIGYLVVRGGGA